MLLHALGSHYLCDMIVAVPWTLSVWSALQKRWVASAAYLAMAVAWMLLVRFGLPVLYASPVIPWFLAAATVTAPALMSLRPAEIPVAAVPESDQA
jgi:hypothetical protein